MERPIHLRQYSICRIEEKKEDSVIVPVWITQSSLDAMQQVLGYLEGLGASGKGNISGTFELTMFYRTLKYYIDKAEEEKKDELPTDNTGV